MPVYVSTGVSIVSKALKGQGVNFNHTKYSAPYIWRNIFHHSLGFELASPSASIDDADLDADGYVNVALDRWIFCKVSGSSGEDNGDRAGTYRFTWDGDDICEVRDQDGVISSGTANNLTFTLDGTESQVQVWMDATQITGDYPRNMQIIPTSYQGPGEPAAVDLTDPAYDGKFLLPHVEKEITNNIAVLRSFWWVGATHHITKEWADRPKLTRGSWNTHFSPGEKGSVPWEAVIGVANQCNSEPWICIPQRVSDDYITQLATYVRDNLDTHLIPHIEFGNEMWNTAFGANYGNVIATGQYHWVAPSETTVDTDFSGWTASGGSIGGDNQTFTADGSTGEHYIESTIDPDEDGTRRSLFTITVDQETSGGIHVLIDDGTDTLDYVLDMDNETVVSRSGNGDDSWREIFFFDHGDGTKTVHSIFQRASTGVPLTIRIGLVDSGQNVSFTGAGETLRITRVYSCIASAEGLYKDYYSKRSTQAMYLWKQVFDVTGRRAHYGLMWQKGGANSSGAEVRAGAQWQAQDGNATVAGNPFTGWVDPMTCHTGLGTASYITNGIDDDPEGFRAACDVSVANGAQWIISADATTGALRTKLDSMIPNVMEYGTVALSLGKDFFLYEGGYEWITWPTDHTPVPGVDVNQSDAALDLTGNNALWLITRDGGGEFQSAVPHPDCYDAWQTGLRSAGAGLIWQEFLDTFRAYGGTTFCWLENIKNSTPSSGLYGMKEYPTSPDTMEPYQSIFAWRTANPRWWL